MKAAPLLLAAGVAIALAGYATWTVFVSKEDPSAVDGPGPGKPSLVQPAPGDPAPPVREPAKRPRDPARAIDDPGEEPADGDLAKALERFDGAMQTLRGSSSYDGAAKQAYEVGGKAIADMYTAGDDPAAVSERQTELIETARALRDGG